MIWWVWQPNEWKRAKPVEAESKRAALIRWAKAQPWNSLGWVVFVAEVAPRHGAEGYQYSVMPRTTYHVEGC
jgi:hypothetical protein